MNFRKTLIACSFAMLAIIPAMNAQKNAKSTSSKAGDAASTVMTFEQAKQNFHKYMSSTFHPMEEGNYKPIREMSGELAAAANKWLKTPLGKAEMEKNSDNSITEILTQLTERTAQLDAKIKGGCDDTYIREELTAIHEIFHKLVEKCRPEQEETK